jgi:hypothetical protein
MKRLLFLIFFLSAIAYGQTNPMADEVRVQGLKDTLETRIDSVISAIGTIEGSTDTRLDSLIAALTAVESAADTRIDSILANSLPALNTRTDSLIAVVSADKDSTTSHNNRINALLDTAKVHQDTLGSHNDRILALLDSVNNHYSQAILDILLAAKFDKDDTTDYYTDAMIDALLAYKFDKSDTSSYYKAVYLDALLSYYFLKSDTTDYYKDVMVDALLGYKLNITDTSYQVQDSYLTALLPYYYVRTDTSSATLGFYPRNMIDAKIAEITGSGVITLNGLSGVSQTFAIDTTIAGAPAWSSVGTTHTLQLPFLRFLKQSDTTTTLAMQWELDGKMAQFDTTGRWAPAGDYSGAIDTSDRWAPAGDYVMPEDTTGQWAPAGDYSGGTSFSVTDSTLIFPLASFAGVDSTGADTCQSAINAALDYIRSVGGKARFTHGTYLIRAAAYYANGQPATSVEVAATGGINLKSNDYIIIDPTATIQAMTDTLACYLMFIATSTTGIPVENITITGGGTIRGDRLTHDYTKDLLVIATHEHGHCIYLGACKNVTIRDLNLIGATGDGVCLSRYGTTYTEPYTRVYASNILIDNVRIDSCRRQGISALQSDNLTVRNCPITNTGVFDGVSNGTAPMAAIDIESGTDKKPTHTVIEGGFFYNNVGGTNLFDGEDVTVSNLHTDGTVAIGYANNTTMTKCNVKMADGNGTALSVIEGRELSSGSFTYAGDSLDITTTVAHGYSVGDSVSLDILKSSVKFKIAGGTYMITSSSGTSNMRIHHAGLGLTSGYVRMLGRYTVTDYVVSVTFPYTHGMGVGEKVYIDYRNSNGISQLNSDAEYQGGIRTITAIVGTTGSKGFSFIDSSIVTAAGALNYKSLHSNAVVANNIFVGGSINLAGYNFNFHDNIVLDAGEYGIYVGGIFNGQINKNTIQNCYYGIYGSGYDLDIIDNTITDVQLRCINLLSGKNISINDNTFRNSSIGIQSSGVGNLIIDNNTFDLYGYMDTTPSYDIYLYANDSSRAYVTRNKFPNSRSINCIYNRQMADIYHNEILGFRGTTAIRCSIATSSIAPRKRNNIIGNIISCTTASTPIESIGDSLSLIADNKIWITGSTSLTNAIKCDASEYSRIINNIIAPNAGVINHDASDTLFMNIVGNTFDPPLPGTYKHFYALIDTPLYRYTQDSIIALTYKTTEAITIAGIQISCNANPDTEIAGNLVYADDLITRANPVIINSINTADGALSDVSITSASVATGKAIYLRLTAEPDAATKWVCVDIIYKAAGY